MTTTKPIYKSKIILASILVALLPFAEDILHFVNTNQDIPEDVKKIASLVLGFAIMYWRTTVKSKITKNNDGVSAEDSVDSPDHPN